MLASWVEVLVIEPEASNLPSGDQLTDETPLAWPSSVCSSLSWLGSHTHTALSPELKASNPPLGDQLIDQIPNVRPFSVCSNLPRSSSHTRTVPSLEPKASNLPSGDQLTLTGDQFTLNDMSLFWSTFSL